MEKIVIHTDKAASGKVPLSQAIQVGEWLHCSGQLPLDPATGQLVPGGAAEQTRQIIENLKAVCEAGGTSLKNAVKVTIFMEDLADLQERIGQTGDGRSRQGARYLQHSLRDENLIGPPHTRRRS